MERDSFWEVPEFIYFENYAKTAPIHALSSFSFSFSSSSSSEKFWPSQPIFSIWAGF